MFIMDLKGSDLNAWFNSGSDKICQCHTSLTFRTVKILETCLNKVSSSHKFEATAGRDRKHVIAKTMIMSQPEIAEPTRN